MQIQLGTSKECMFAPINNTPDKKKHEGLYIGMVLLLSKSCVPK